jgi:hypothetical protein
MGFAFRAIDGAKAGATAPYFCLGAEFREKSIFERS